MSPAQMAEMFKPFVQANETITRKYGGTGLGLSIVKNLVEQMGGSIEVQSEVGKGSVFRVDLPLKVDVAGSEEEKVRRKSISFSSLRALMVLNDGLLIDRVNTMFKEYHIHIDGVSSLKLASGIMKDGQGYDLLAIEVDRLSAIPAEFVQALVAMGERKPKVLVFIHDEGSLETEGALQNHCDIILPLPIVNSVLLNALLQLFGTGQTPARVSQQMEKLGRSEPMNVLVVEDNLTNQLIARELLERTGCTVFVANNGKQGLEVFLEKEALIDVVLMDLHMDVMDGYEATTLIRQKNPTVPILVLSADVMESVRERCIRSGATDLIGKPYDPDVMVAKVFEVGTAYKHAVNEEAAIDADLGLKQAGGDRHVYALILDAFVTETRGTLADLKAAIRSGDFPAAAELAHTCKGGCGAVGATKARKLCSELQKALNEKRFTPEHALVKELFDEMDRVLDQAQRYRE
jgi:CheY-like chemotaxis protein